MTKNNYLSQFYSDLLIDLENIPFIQNYLTEFNTSVYELCHPDSEQNKTYNIGNDGNINLSFLYHYRTPQHSSSDYNQKQRSVYGHILQNFLKSPQYYSQISNEHIYLYSHLCLSFQTFFNTYTHALHSPLVHSFTEEEYFLLQSFSESIENDNFPFKDLISPDNIADSINYAYGILKTIPNNYIYSDSQQSEAETSMYYLESLIPQFINNFLHNSQKKSLKENDPFLSLISKEAAAKFSNFLEPLETKISEERNKLSFIEWSNLFIIQDKGNIDNNREIHEFHLISQNHENPNFTKFLASYHEKYISNKNRHQKIFSQNSLNINCHLLSNDKQNIYFSFQCAPQTVNEISELFHQLIREHISEIYYIHSDDTQMIMHSFSSFFNRLKDFEREALLLSEFSKYNHISKETKNKPKI